MANKKNIKCIIFDVGGVLLKEKIDKVHDAINKELGKKVFDRKDAIHRKAVLGKLTEKELFRILSKKYGVHAKRLQALSHDKYLKIVKTNKDVMMIAKTLQKDYKTCILSNVTPMHKKHDHVMEIYSFFDHVVLSCDIGAMKPNKKIFKEAMKKLHAKPKECIYIEDREEFLETPKKLGMNVIHFKNAAQLKKDLRKNGVKI